MSMTDRPELEAALARVEDVIATLGTLSARVHQPGLFVEDALVQLSDVPATLRYALAELDSELQYRDDLENGEPEARARAAEEADAGYRDAAQFRVGGRAGRVLGTCWGIRS